MKKLSNITLTFFCILFLAPCLPMEEDDHFTKPFSKVSNHSEKPSKLRKIENKWINGLHMAALRGELEAAKFVFEKLSNVASEKTGILGLIPFDYANKKGRTGVADFLDTTSFL